MGQQNLWNITVELFSLLSIGSFSMYWTIDYVVKCHSPSLLTIKHCQMFCWPIFIPAKAHIFCLVLFYAAQLGIRDIPSVITSKKKEIIVKKGEKSIDEDSISSKNPLTCTCLSRLLRRPLLNLWEAKTWLRCGSRSLKRHYSCQRCQGFQCSSLPPPA